MWVLACVANGVVIKRQQSLAGDALKSHLPEDYGFFNGLVSVRTRGSR